MMKITEYARYKPFAQYRHYQKGWLFCDRGAFRRFKDAIILYNLEDNWYSYKHKALCKVARDWCEVNDISFVVKVIYGYYVNKQQHHTLTQILMCLINAGFRLDTVEEAMPNADMIDIPGMSDEMRRPMMLLIKIDILRGG